MYQSFTTPFGEFRIPPGGRFTISVEFPSEPPPPASSTPSVEPTDPPTDGGAAVRVVTRGGPPVVGASTTALDRVRRIRTTRGNVSLKRAAWAAETGVPLRELKRATKANAIESSVKMDGRDNGAVMITAKAMEAYLAIVAAVRSGDMSPPVWWDAVHDWTERETPGTETASARRAPLRPTTDAPDDAKKERRSQTRAPRLDRAA